MSTIKELLAVRGLSNRRAAKLAGLDEGLFNAIAGGRRPTLKTAARIAKMLNVSAGQLWDVQKLRGF